MIAGLQVAHTWSDLLDDAGALMPADQWQCERKVALANVMIGVTQPRRFEGDEHFALFGAVELHLFDTPLLVNIP
ncbi:hypothetical protein MSIM_10430 [Mycobacterium simiae]|nr:hypothetical protein MSIM_10430 [Mycobacterium simiae]